MPQLDKKFLERFLRLNNVSLDAPDKDIRDALHAARWDEEEIRACIQILRNKGDISGVGITKSHSISFRPDMSYSRSELSALLGIDLVIDGDAVGESSGKGLSGKHISLRHILIWLAIVALAVGVAAGLAFILMYILKVGAYYSPIR